MEPVEKREATSKNPTIIPIASGKGGVGKSMMAANLAISFAQMGHNTVAIDLDLGSSNLHFMLGIKHDIPGIGDYLRSDDIPFESLGEQMEWPHLKFIPGEGRVPFMANITYNQKINLIKKIKEIPAEYVILDLSAGASFNVLDFFSMSDNGIIVTPPNRVAAINMLSFLKQHLLRRIKRAFLRHDSIGQIIDNLFQQTNNPKQIPIRDLINKVKESDEAAAKEIVQICSKCQPMVVYNMLNETNDLRIVKIIDQSASNVLSISLNHIGAVLTDLTVPQSINKGVSLLKFNPESLAAKNIFNLAGQIVHPHDKKEDCETFIQETLKLFQNV